MALNLQRSENLPQAQSMGQPDPKLAERILAEALTRPVAQRAAFLASACGDDLDLRRRLEASVEQSSATGESGSLSSLTLDIEGDGPGATIGRYRLLQLIGEGGFGSVYLAEQEEPVRRRVALKIIKVGMDTRRRSPRR